MTIPDSAAISLLIALSVLLLSATLFTVAAIFISRWRLSRLEDRKGRIRERIGERVIRFISGDLSIDGIQILLNHKLDYIILLEVVNQLDEALDGPEEKRLQDLLDVESTRRHFLHRFETGNPLEQAKACLYFARRRRLEPDLPVAMMKLTRSRTPFLCYSAATALMKHGSDKQKRRALKAIFLNPGISNMAAADLVVRYTAHGDEYHEEEMKALLELIRDPEMPESRRPLLIRSLDELGYFNSANELLEYYRSLDTETTSPETLSALIEVLTRFGAEEILPDLHRRHASSPHAGIRAAAAFAFGFFRSPLSIPHLKWMVNDPDDEVRYQATRSMGLYPDLDLNRVPCYILGDDSWERLKGEVQSELETGGP